MSLLNFIKDLIALTLGGRLFHNSVQLYQKLRFKIFSLGLMQGKFVLCVEQLF